MQFPTEDIPTLSETFIPPESGYDSLMDASAVTPVVPFDPLNPMFPQSSVSCDSLSKLFAVNITSCGDEDSSTVRPYTHAPSDYEPTGQMVSLPSVGIQPLASTPNVTRECHPTPRFWGSIFSHKANIISTHDDTLGVDP